jgi:hypothetical protein
MIRALSVNCHIPFTGIRRRAAGRARHADLTSAAQCISAHRCQSRQRTRVGCDDLNEIIMEQEVRNGPPNGNQE